MYDRKYGMCARKYGPLGHQTDKIQNDVILSYEVSGLHITSPYVKLAMVWLVMLFHSWDTSKLLHCDRTMF